MTVLQREIDRVITEAEQVVRAECPQTETARDRLAVVLLISCIAAYPLALLFGLALLIRQVVGS